MTSDIICFNNGYKCTCRRCKGKIYPGDLMNVFRWNEKMTIFCMKCLVEMGIDRDITWSAEQEKDPRMIEKDDE